MSKPIGRRAAARPQRRWPIAKPDSGATRSPEPGPRRPRLGRRSGSDGTSGPAEGPPRAQSRLLPALHVTLVVLGLAAVGVAELERAGLWTQAWVPGWLGGAGAVVVATTYVWILAARTGGRSLVFAALALGIGVLAVVLDYGFLSTGAAVMTSAAGAALGVMVTVPAVRFFEVVREVVLALAVAAAAAAAAVGFQPRITLVRFDYATLAVSLALVLALVYRLGAGLHGLGTRGAVVVVVGGLSLGIALAYGELLSRYGTPGLVDTARALGVWMHDHLGAVPRPLAALLGIPALAWGCHQRARRRQGWWACAFGVTATASVAHLVLDPRVTLVEAGLSELYTLVVGLAIGYLVVRLDLLLTGSRGKGGRRAEEASAVRPEPARTAALF